MSKIAGKTAHAVNQFFINLRQKMGTDAYYRIFKTITSLGAANLKNPYACRDIVRALPAEMARCGIENLTDIIGGAHHG